MENSKTDDLFGRTWKTVAVLVGACVLFVGSLSGAAVLITSRAFPDSQHGAAVSGGDEVKADAKSDAAKTNGGKTSPASLAKKPVSI